MAKRSKSGKKKAGDATHASTDEVASSAPCARVRTAEDLAALLVGMGPEDAAELASLAEELRLQGSRDEGLFTSAADLIAAVADGRSADAEADLAEACRLLAGDTEAESPPEPVAETPAAVGAFGVMPADADIELIAEYIIESCENLKKAEAALLELENDPADAEHLYTVFNAFHTVKGTSGFLGIEHVQRVAHLAEDLLEQARAGKILLVGDCADLALRACDMMRVLVIAIEDVNPGEPFPEAAGYRELIERLSHLDSSRPNSQEAILKAGCHPDPDAPAREKRSESSIRVSVERLDSLVNAVGELVIAQTMISKDPDVASNRNVRLTTNVHRADKIVRQLQELTIALRMVPLRDTFQKMARLVRDLARRSCRPVELVVEGEDTEIDRGMVETISDPLVHLMRNAVDHGIEPPDARTAAGKPAEGRVTLRAYHSAGSVFIEVADDGRGLDEGRILEKAVERGLVSPSASLSRAEILDLVFLPGLSTARQVTELSGRGVGMDVVRKQVESLRGQVHIRSTPGHGTTFVIRVPLTMAIMDAMILSVGGSRYMLPTLSIVQSFRPEPGAVSTVVGRGEMAMYRNELLPVVRLTELFAVEGGRTDPTAAILVIVEVDGRRGAIMVDDLLGQDQVVIKSLGSSLTEVPGVSGGAILWDGSVGLILDAGGLLEIAHGRDGGGASMGGEHG